MKTAKLNCEMTLVKMSGNPFGGGKVRRERNFCKNQRYLIYAFNGKSYENCRPHCHEEKKTPRHSRD